MSGEQYVLVRTKDLHIIEERSRSSALRSENEVVVDTLLKEFNEFGIDSNRLGIITITLHDHPSGIPELFETFSREQLRKIRVWNMLEEVKLSLASFPVLRTSFPKDLGFVFSDGRHRLAAVSRYRSQVKKTGKEDVETYFHVRMLFDCAEVKSRRVSLHESRPIITNATCVTDVMKCLPSPGSAFAGVKEVLNDNNFHKKLMLPDTDTLRKVIVLSYALFPEAKVLMEKNRESKLFETLAIIQPKKSVMNFLSGIENVCVFTPKRSLGRDLFRGCSMRFKKKAQMSVFGTVIGTHSANSTYRASGLLNRIALSFLIEFPRNLPYAEMDENEEETVIWKTIATLLRSRILRDKSQAKLSDILRFASSAICSVSRNMFQLLPNNSQAMDTILSWKVPGASSAGTRAQIPAVVPNASLSANGSVSDFVDSSGGHISSERRREPPSAEHQSPETEEKIKGGRKSRIENLKEPFAENESNKIIDEREKGKKDNRKGGTGTLEGSFADDQLQKNTAVERDKVVKDGRGPGIQMKKDSFACQSKKIVDEVAVQSNGTAGSRKGGEKLSTDRIEKPNEEEELGVEELEESVEDVQAKKPVAGGAMRSESYTESKRFSQGGEHLSSDRMKETTGEEQNGIAACKGTTEDTQSNSIEIVDEELEQTKETVESGDEAESVNSTVERLEEEKVEGQPGIDVLNDSVDEDLSSSIQIVDEGATHKKQALQRRRGTKRRLSNSSGGRRATKQKLFSINTNDKERCLYECVQFAMALDEWFQVLSIRFGGKERLLAHVPKVLAHQKVAFFDTNEFWRKGLQAEDALAECVDDGLIFDYLVDIRRSASECIPETISISGIVYTKRRLFLVAEKDWNLFSNPKNIGMLAIVYDLHQAEASGPHTDICVWSGKEDESFLCEVFRNLTKAPCAVFDFTCSDLFLMKSLCQDRDLIPLISKMYRAMPYSYGAEYRRCYDFLRDRCLEGCDCGGHDVLRDLPNDAETVQNEGPWKPFHSLVGESDKHVDFRVIPHASLLLRKVKNGKTPSIGDSDSALCGVQNDSNGAPLELGAFLSAKDVARITEMNVRARPVLLFPKAQLVDARTAMTDFSNFTSPFDLRVLHISGVTNEHLWYFMNNDSVGSLLNTSHHDEDICVYLQENYKSRKDFEMLAKQGVEAFMKPETAYLRIVLSVSRLNRRLRRSSDRDAYKCSVCGAVELFVSYGDEYVVPK